MNCGVLLFFGLVLTYSSRASLKGDTAAELVDESLEGVLSEG